MFCVSNAFTKLKCNFWFLCCNRLVLFLPRSKLNSVGSSDRRSVQGVISPFLQWPLTGRWPFLSSILCSITFSLFSSTLIWSSFVSLISFTHSSSFTSIVSQFRFRIRFLFFSPLSTKLVRLTSVLLLFFLFSFRSNFTYKKKRTLKSIKAMEVYVESSVWVCSNASFLLLLLTFSLCHFFLLILFTFLGHRNSHSANLYFFSSQQWIFWRFMWNNIKTNRRNTFNVFLDVQRINSLLLRCGVSDFLAFDRCVIDVCLNTMKYLIHHFALEYIYRRIKHIQWLRNCAKFYDCFDSIWIVLQVKIIIIFYLNCQVWL